VPSPTVAALVVRSRRPSRRALLARCSGAGFASLAPCKRRRPDSRRRRQLTSSSGHLEIQRAASGWRVGSTTQAGRQARAYAACAGSLQCAKVLSRERFVSFDLIATGRPPEQTTSSAMPTTVRELDLGRTCCCRLFVVVARGRLAGRLSRAPLVSHQRASIIVSDGGHYDSRPSGALAGSQPLSTSWRRRRQQAYSSAADLPPARPCTGAAGLRRPPHEDAPGRWKCSRSVPSISEAAWNPISG
jgi:hypothetical protein